MNSSPGYSAQGPLSAGKVGEGLPCGAKASKIELTSSQLYSFLADGVEDLIALIDRFGTRIWHNAAYCRELGYTEGELSSFSTTTVLHPEDRERVNRVFDESMDSGIGQRIEYRMMRKDGSVLHLESRGRVVIPDGTSNKLLLIVARDISSRKAEEARRTEIDQRLHAQNTAWMNLTRSTELQLGHWESSLSLIPSVAATTLNCSRSGIWWINESRCECQIVYARQTSDVRLEERGPVHLTADYLVALKCERSIAALDARQDPRLKAWEEYFRRFDITSVLHIPFFRKGDLVGVFTCEEVERPRIWTADEESFTASLTDLVLLTMQDRERQKAHAELEESQRHLADELNEAAQYVRSLLPQPLRDGDIRADWRFVSSAALGGDAFGYHWIDPDHMAIYLLDVCGHGIGSALLSISAINVLRLQSLRHTDFRKPDQVLERMSDTFLMENQNYMYFTLWYGVYRKSTRILSYASAGHPSAFLFPSRSHPGLTMGYDSLCVGAERGIHFPVLENKISAGAVLYLFSDGVFEIQENDGTFWNYSSFIEQLRTLNMLGKKIQSPLDHLMETAKRAMGQSVFTDDYSIIRFEFD